MQQFYWLDFAYIEIRLPRITDEPIQKYVLVKDQALNREPILCLPSQKNAYMHANLHACSMRFINTEIHMCVCACM